MAEKSMSVVVFINEKAGSIRAFHSSRSFDDFKEDLAFAPVPPGYSLLVVDVVHFCEPFHGDAMKELAVLMAEALAEEARKLKADSEKKP